MQPHHLSDIAHGAGPGRAHQSFLRGIFERLALTGGSLCSSRKHDPGDDWWEYRSCLGAARFYRRDLWLPGVLSRVYADCRGRC